MLGPHKVLDPGSSQDTEPWVSFFRYVIKNFWYQWCEKCYKETYFWYTQCLYWKKCGKCKRKTKKIEIKKSFIWLFHSNLGPPTKRKPHSLDLNHYALFFRPESIRQLLWDPKLGRAHLWDSNLESSNSKLMRYTNR